MIVAADTRILTNHGYLRTRDHRLATLAQPEAKSTANYPIFCKPIGEQPLFEYIIDLGNSLVCNEQWDVGSNIFVGVINNTSFGSYKHSSRVGAILGMLSHGLIDLKNHFAFINSLEKEIQEDVEYFLNVYRRDTRELSLEQYVQNDYTGGSQLFDVVASIEPDPILLTHAVPEVIWIGNCDVVRDYLSALPRIEVVRQVDHNYVSVLTLRNNLFARQVQMLLQNFGVISKIFNDNEITMDMFAFGKYVANIGIYNNSHKFIDHVYSLYDRAIAKPTSSYATIVSAKPYEKVACSKIYSDEFIIANGIVINPVK